MARRQLELSNDVAAELAGAQDSILRTLNSSDYPPPRGWDKWDLHALIMVTEPWYERVWPHLD